MPSNNVFQYSKIRTRNKVRRKALKPEKKWNPALFGIRNPLCWNPESSTRNPESTAWNPESKTVLDSLTWGEEFVEISHVLLRVFSCLFKFRKGEANVITGQSQCRRAAENSASQSRLEAVTSFKGARETFTCSLRH